jgi:hypothetical protein
VTISTGIITTIAGTGSSISGFSGDNGPATSATFDQVYDVTIDATGRDFEYYLPVLCIFYCPCSHYLGNVYIADFGNHRVRKVTISTGFVTTIAGTGTGSYSGDGGDATAAKLNNPYGLSLDSAGNIYIADYTNNRIRKVSISTGIISTVAGSSTSGSYSGDGDVATSATLYDPIGISLDSAGNIYIADSSNRRIRKVTASTGIISTIAGTGMQGYSGDGGEATSATFKGPHGLAVDASSNVYISDTFNFRIRKVVTVPATSTPRYSLILPAYKSFY